MAILNELVAVLALCFGVIAAPLEERATCSSYTIINTRGTGEPQGPSSGFRTMNTQITSQVSGSTIYNTVYAAGVSQNSAAGTRDIVNKITSTLRTSPNECFVLEGYSQGAAATTNAMTQLTGNAFTAVRAVVLLGNPNHKRGLACNVDSQGGTTTKNVNGLSAFGSAGVPSNWVSKTLDICAYGDGVCDTTHGYGINAAHLSYPSSSSAQRLGSTFAVEKLRA
ncbi:Putative cutinase/acetylxylan esterase, alpha/Beta hydrolase [Septoria linicola]|uniref:Cutinase/acetylxylan esterase, alpha/Beta hydrolase n=1 Tax=Septoria linicola TaxID=215465 RepID=A0A9Q9AHI4_9PEZI|nr:putative cutinase/acetylxylan esterase, alpha/Beta hydrolase [Septoria linicola]USW47799.1 Putative cutinase/acetylxylan esterase, alpha/Beta hydrolase [Septoria linicola]